MPFKSFVVFVVLEVWVVQLTVLPSGEVTTTPPLPTAVNCIPEEATLFRFTDGAAFAIVQIDPVTEVITFPLLPTPANAMSDLPTSFRLIRVDVVCRVHATPSVDVRIVPSRPTATNCFPKHAILQRELDVPDDCDTHGVIGFIPSS
jgi:hypothetical protein